jgi:hypothetical protein
VTGTTIGTVVVNSVTTPLDANGHAEVQLPAGSSVSVVFPAASVRHAYTLFDVQPGDAIRFGRAFPLPTATVHVTVPAVAGAGRYVVHTNCSSTPSATAGVIDVGFCGASSFVYVETLDATGAGIGSFFVDTVASDQNVTAAFQPQLAAQVAIAGVPSGATTVSIHTVLVTPQGTMLERTTTASVDGTATLMLPAGVPAGELRLRIEIDDVVVSARHPFTGAPDAIAVDVTGKVMPAVDGIAYHVYSRVMSWQEIGEAPARTGVAMHLVYADFGHNGGNDTWDIAAPDSSPLALPYIVQTDWIFPGGPSGTHSATVTCDVDPRGYDGERGTLLFDDGFPADGTTSRRLTADMTYPLN